MKVRVRGKNPKITTKELKYATKFMSNILMTKKLVEQLDVTIKFVDMVDDGGTMLLDCNHKPREFEVQLNPKLNREHTLYVLGHELTHVRQFARGQLKQLAREASTTWLRKKYNAKLEDDPLRYWLLPWEIEARGYEEALMQYYKSHLKDRKRLDKNRKKRYK